MRTKKLQQADTPDTSVEMKNFAGLVTNSNPHDLPPGTATAMLNVAVIRPGELRARQGSRVVLFH